MCIDNIVYVVASLLNMGVDKVLDIDRIRAMEVKEDEKEFVRDPEKRNGKALRLRVKLVSETVSGAQY